jgi:hypothetical protein
MVSAVPVSVDSTDLSKSRPRSPTVVARLETWPYLHTVIFSLGCNYTHGVEILRVFDHLRWSVWSYISSILYNRIDMFPDFLLLVTSLRKHGLLGWGLSWHGPMVLGYLY